MAESLRTRHCSRRTEQAYIHWMRRFISFHALNHPRQLREGDVNRFLTHLAIGENVAAPTHNQALAAVHFLCEHVLEQPLDRIEGVVRASRPKRLPVVPTRDDVEARHPLVGGLVTAVAGLVTFQKSAFALSWQGLV